MRLLARNFLPALLLLALGSFTWGQVSTTSPAQVSRTENPRLVVLETFMRPGWGLSIATGTVVEQLNAEYAAAGKMVVFIEDNVDTPVGGRKSYFWAAFGGGSAYLPLTMVDSGHGFTSGYDANSYQTYKDLIDASLARTAQAGFDLLRSSRVSNHLHFEGRVANWMPTTLPAAAKVHILIFEEHTPVSGEHITNRILRAHLSQSTGVDLPTNASVTFSMDTAELTNIVDWGKVRAVALIDYRPGVTAGAYDMLQATMIYPLSNIYLPILRK